MLPLIDIVISTKDNVLSKDSSIIFTIRSLLYQKDVRLNIIVAVNGTDGTEDLIRANFGSVVGIIDTSNLAGNISASRNKAVSCGHADLIFFSDDDMIPEDAHTLRRCLELAVDVDFSCGAKRLWAPITWPSLVRTDDPINKFISTLEAVSREPHSINRLSGKNILDNRSYIGNFGFVKRDCFEALGGFDEKYIGFGYQDTDLMYRLCLSLKTYAIMANYKISCYHLSHIVNKGPSYEINRQRFRHKQEVEGRLFNTNHFFEIYEDDGYSLFADFRAPRIL